MSAAPGFNDFWSAWRWAPIPGCPGRYWLAANDPYLPITGLLGSPIPVTDHDVPAARDRVFVARLCDGGIISYLRPDGTCLHTLNTAAGFERKLRQLGIALDAV